MTGTTEWPFLMATLATAQVAEKPNRNCTERNIVYDFNYICRDPLKYWLAHADNFDTSQQRLKSGYYHTISKICLGGRRALFAAIKAYRERMWDEIPDIFDLEESEDAQV